MGLKSYIHRHDIVFSQAVTVAITSFVFKLLQSFTVPSFLTQLHKVVGHLGSRDCVLDV